MAESVMATDTLVRAIEGGRWQNGQFYYNRSVNNVNVTNIHNVYNTTVINNTTVNRVSYNGGNGGITRVRGLKKRPRHVRDIRRRWPLKRNMSRLPARQPELRASVNHGTPTVAATPKPGAFNDRAVIPARAAGTPYNPPRESSRRAATGRMLQLRNQKMEPHAPTSLRRIIGRNRTEGAESCADGTADDRPESNRPPYGTAEQSA